MSGIICVKVYTTSPGWTCELSDVLAEPCGAYTLLVIGAAALTCLRESLEQDNLVEAYHVTE